MNLVESIRTKLPLKPRNRERPVDAALGGGRHARRARRAADDAVAVVARAAGGQFVHRMLSFGYRDRVAAAISANAGTYAMPDLGVAWPFGLGQTEVTPETLVPLLNFPLTVMAGTKVKC